MDLSTPRSRIKAFGGLVLGLTLWVLLAIGIALPTMARAKCYDCGEAGWQKMSDTCGAAVAERSGAMACMAKFKWSGVTAKTAPTTFSEGYIGIGESTVHDKAGKGLIKVFIHERWAIDADGNLYLRSELG